MRSFVSVIECLEARRLLSSIAGAVFNDLNADGARNAGEPPLATQKVFLDTNRNGVLDAGEASVLTNSAGGYSFANLTPGYYSVAAVTPAGFKQTTAPPTGLIPLSPAHDYPLKGNFLDANGGPSLIGTGGTITASGYVFAAAQGPRLLNALTNTGNYTIQLVFSMNDVSGYRKVIDFANRGSDAGLYVLNGELIFYGGNVAGQANTIADNKSVDVVLTRNAQTKVVTGYVNGVQQFSFTDTSNQAVFSGPNGVINLLQDDTATNREYGAGTLTHVSLFNSPLTAAQVAALPNITTPSRAGEWLVKLAASQSVTGRDFGFKALGPTHLKGTVFNDTNGDGVRQPAEAAIANAVVFIDANGNGKLDAGEQTTHTAADGTYDFAGLAPGTYHIAVVPNTGFVVTAPTAAGVSLSHDYELIGNLNDSTGGPALTSGGGSISTSGYSFAAGKGPSLSLAAINPASYSIEMRVKLSNISGYNKLIDFKNRVSDLGLYVLNGSLDFYSFASGNKTPIAANTFYDIVLTRNASTKVVTGYVNGVQQFSFVDTNGDAVFSAAPVFLRDDTHTNTEQSGGVLSRLRIYSGVLSASQIASIHSGSQPPAASHDYTITLAAGQTTQNLNFAERKFAF